MDFRGKTVVVTGAASGLGAEVANAFAAAGADMAIIDLNEAGIKAKAEEISADGQKIIGYACDLTDYDAVQDLGKAILAEFGKVDALCNIAGANPAGVNKEILDQDKKGWDTVMNLNVNITFNAIKAFVPSMVERKYGKVVNIASVAGVMGGGLMGKGAYSPAKAAVIGLTKVLAREIGPSGVCVNAVSPGMHFTPMVTDLNNNEGSRDTVQRIINQLPLHKGGDPKNLAQLFLFLASDNADFMTGTNICVDGGYTMH